MSTRLALEALDPSRLRDAFDGAFDKCTNFEEAGVMVDRLADEFPALAGLLERLRARITDEVVDEPSSAHAVFGGALVLLALVEYVEAEAFRSQFPDTPV